MLGYTFKGRTIMVRKPMKQKETPRKYIEINIAHSTHGFVVKVRM